MHAHFAAKIIPAKTEITLKDKMHFTVVLVFADAPPVVKNQQNRFVQDSKKNDVRAARSRWTGEV